MAGKNGFRDQGGKSPIRRICLQTTLCGTEDFLSTPFDQ